MGKYRIIDTFSEFLAFWSEACGKTVEEQIDGWASQYMSGWPELLARQIDDYAGQGLDWREVAAEKVFPLLPDALAAMRLARDNLRTACGIICSRAEQVFECDIEVAFVIYVGIGCGAGWVTEYQNSPAILFGLEKIAECGWSERNHIEALVAHEMGHIVHFQWREQAGKGRARGPFWQLYTEGFAQRCEHLILGEETWHEARGINEADWLDWCRSNTAYLAAEFLRMAEAGEPVRPFFGDWFDIRGRKQCGYFLGHELIRQLETSLPLEDIALLDDIDERFKSALQAIAKAGRPGRSPGG